MKKIYRESQMMHVLGRRIGGMRMHEYGLPYNGAFGAFLPNDPDSIDLMLAAVEAYPELHVVSYMENGWHLNRYDADALSYNLYLGNADPDIEFNCIWSPDDTTDEERQEGIQFMEKHRATLFDFTPAQQAAMDWFYENRLKQKITSSKEDYFASLKLANTTPKEKMQKNSSKKKTF